MVSLYPSCVFVEQEFTSFFLSDSQIIENVHSILATAASKLNLELYEHLTTLIKKKWEISEGRVREKLLRLIGLIGREAKSSKSIEATLAVLWEVVSRLCFNF
jgi:ubiquitin carboxyl-terminal hydrolase 9/24